MSHVVDAETGERVDPLVIGRCMQRHRHQEFIRSSMRRQLMLGSVCFVECVVGEEYPRKAG